MTLYGQHFPSSLRLDLYVFGISGPWRIGSARNQFQFCIGKTKQLTNVVDHLIQSKPAYSMICRLPLNKKNYLDTG